MVYPLPGISLLLKKKSMPSFTHQMQEREMNEEGHLWSIGCYVSIVKTLFCLLVHNFNYNDECLSLEPLLY